MLDNFIWTSCICVIVRIGRRGGMKYVLTTYGNRGVENVGEEEWFMVLDTE